MKKTLILGCSFAVGSYDKDDNIIENSPGWYNFVDALKDDLVTVFACPSMGFLAYAQILTLIKPEAFDILMAVYDLMTKYGNTDFLIEGHRDTSGPKVFNDKLSLDRANEVKSHLIEKGVDSDRLSTVGYGEDKPKVSNSTRKGRITNRRVEFKVVD